MGDFLDSEERALEAEMAGLKAASKGDEVFFGDYRWLVLSHKENMLKLIVKTVNRSGTPELYEHAFHTAVKEGGSGIAWADCDLRTWLNGEFLSEHFTEGEKACLQQQDIAGSENTEYGTSYAGTAGGEDDAALTDMVTILSAKQANHYKSTLSDIGLNWWLRTPGNSLEAAAFYTSENKINWYGDDVTDTRMAVRPVIVVNAQ